MVESRVLQIVRQFWENAIKLLLENPQNVRELLALAGADVVKRIDLRRVELVRTTFVERDYRHMESDIVLVAPMRPRKGERTARRVSIYILVEHQSEPDRLMPLRSLDYVVQIPIM
jgi:translation elongation factor EF-Ts